MDPHLLPGREREGPGGPRAGFRFNEDSSAPWADFLERSPIFFRIFVCSVGDDDPDLDERPFKAA